jgi:hypothetical protein
METTQEAIGRIDRQTSQLARNILFALKLAGRPFVTRSEIRLAYSGLAWVPTVGELSEALRKLEKAKRVRLVIHSYLDSGSTEIHV